ncbi:MAG TPA: hypothetical protein ENF81_03985 [Thermotogaceae bacterium]|nr:hypothetical protein [Thermotogaceae bacterium]
MKKMVGRFALVAGLIGGLVFGAFLSDGIIKVAQKNSDKTTICTVDKDSNRLAGLAGLVKDRSV